MRDLTGPRISAIASGVGHAGNRRCVIGIQKRLDAGVAPEPQPWQCSGGSSGKDDQKRRVETAEIEEGAVRKPSRAVELDDIISSQIIGDDAEVIALALKIHLALEAILIEFIQLTDPSDQVYKMSFPAKTSALVASGVISAGDRAAFDLVNDFRNDFAHIFGHSVTLAQTLALARALERHGVDFSDSAGHYSEQQASEYYGGTIGILAEAGWCILFHAAHLLMEAGGRDIFSAPRSS